MSEPIGGIEKVCVGALLCVSLSEASNIHRTTVIETFLKHHHITTAHIAYNNLQTSH